MSVNTASVSLTGSERINGRMTSPPVTSPTVSLNGLTALASDIATDAQTLVQQHGSLLKAELVESRDKAVRSVILAGIGVVLLPIAALFLLIGLVHLTIWLFPTLPEWGAWLIWGGVAALIGGICALIGVRGIVHLEVVPHRTLNSLKESWSCLLNRLK